MFFGSPRLLSLFLHLSLCGIACLISSCGFHLRGSVDVPGWLQQVAIVVEQGHHDLEPLLKQQLIAYHVQICTNPTDAQFALIIEHDSVTENISSISSSTTPRQYQLTYRLRFKLQNSKGKEIIPSSQVVISRQSTINSERILGSNDEREITEAEMRREAVLQIIYRLGKTPSIKHYAN
jgi:LPS-assembly lipoprotein